MWRSRESGAHEGHFIVVRLFCRAAWCRYCKVTGKWDDGLCFVRAFLICRFDCFCWVCLNTFAYRCTYASCFTVCNCLGNVCARCVQVNSECSDKSHVGPGGCWILCVVFARFEGHLKEESLLLRCFYLHLFVFVDIRLQPQRFGILLSYWGPNSVLAQQQLHTLSYQLVAAFSWAKFKLQECIFPNRLGTLGRSWYALHHPQFFSAEESICVGVFQILRSWLEESKSPSVAPARLTKKRR